MSRSQLIDRAWILKMFARPSMSGRVNSIDPLHALLNVVFDAFDRFRIRA